MKSLKDKLTDEQETLDILYREGINRPDMPAWTVLGVTQPWWLKREFGRIAADIYQSSSVTEKLNKTMQGQYCLHISVEDGALIAFTPTVEMGQQDRQLKMALGKFLRKFFLLFTDGYISELEATHRAETSAVMCIATTVEDIARVYMKMDGDSGCMRHGPPYFHLPDGHHPSRVYATEGMGVAYFELDGVIKSRSVVYTNGEDKRYVRIYGDPVIGKILARNGYKLKSLAGLNLNTVKVDDYYVMPYLDGIGGNQSIADGTKVILHQGKIRVLSLKEQQRLNGRSASYLYGCKGQTGKMSMAECPDLLIVSCLTGVTFSKLDCAVVQCLNTYGVLGQASEDEIPDNWIELMLYREERWETALCAPDSTYFRYNGDNYLEGEAQRTALNYHQLSQIHYPFDMQWMRNLVQLHSGEWVKSQDTAYILPAEGVERLVFVEDLKALRKEGYINAYTNSATKRLIHKARPTLRTSDTGTVFDAELESPYVKLYGTDIWTNRGKTKRIGAANAYLLKSDTRTAVDLMDDAALVQHLKESSGYNYAENDMTADLPSWESRMERRFTSTFFEFSGPDMDADIRYQYRVSLAEAVTRIVAVTGERSKSGRVYAAYVTAVLPLLMIKVAARQFKYFGDQEARIRETIATAVRLGLVPAPITTADVEAATAVDVEQLPLINITTLATGTSSYGWNTVTSTTATTY